jgi:NAD(P)-dependent dehydrogenase (short-subunit alcohol dehydrogenase family)
MELKEKTILVVGGALGIGGATSQLCAERGARVIIADIDVAAGTRLAAQTGAMFIPVDVTDSKSVRAMADYIDKNYGKLDVLIQSAGILHGAYTPLEEFTEEMFRHVWEVNVNGTFLCLKYTVPLLKRSSKAVVVLFSSPAANAASSSYAYGSSKGGVAAFGIAAAQKLGEEGIRVNMISPGGIDTGLKRSVIAVDAEKRGLDYEKAVANSNLGTPEGVAKVLAWLVSDEADYVRGVISTR